MSVNIHAQEWSAQDSAWLRRVLSGKEELRLNDATRKAILGGTLISTDPAPKSPMLSVPPELPVAGPFENIAQPASRRKRLMELPPSVFILDGLTGGDSLPDNSSPSVLPFTTTVSKSTAAELKRLHALTPRKAAVDNLTPLRSGSVSFGADDALRYIFQPSYRAKMRNRKHATARYTYNQY
ncbi:MAG: DUF4858 domain-containing protein [Tannerella sp.]|nr:DUF4858 domain-containing protein [Tannerella sp.]